MKNLTVTTHHSRSDAFLTTKYGYTKSITSSNPTQRTGTHLPHRLIQHDETHNPTTHTSIGTTFSTTETTKTNPFPPPDNNHPIGDIMTHQKDPNAMRIYFQNINSISKNKWIDWQQAATIVRDLSIDFFGCAETNTAWTEPKRRYAQFQMAKATKQAHLAVASSIEVGTSEYQPGGVCSCVTSRWTGCIKETINDPSGLGRWAGHILYGKQNKNIVLITAYRPVKAAGCQTTYQQQCRIIRNTNSPDPDPRQQFLQDLTKSIAHWTSTNHEIILMIDANESATSHRSAITRFMTDTILSQIHTIHPNATYA
jgi:hypothetical protein